MITVLGPKGGTGKTVTSSNLAVALALEGKSSVLVDLDLQFGDIGLALGLEPTKTIYDLATSGGTLDGDKVDSFLARHPSGARALLAPLRPDQAAAISTAFLREVFEILRSRFDFVLVDTPPAFSPEVIASVDASSHLLMVGMLDALSLKDTKIGLETLGEMGYDPRAITLVLNRADSSVGHHPARRRAAARPRAGRAGRQRPGDPPCAHERAADRRSPSRSRRRPGRTPRSPSATWRSRRSRWPRPTTTGGGGCCCGRRADDGTARADRELAGRPGDPGRERQRQRQRARPVRGAEEPNPPRARQRARPPSLRRRGRQRRPRAGRVGDRRAARAGGGAVARRPQPDRGRDRGRHLRLRPARAAPLRPHDLGDHGQRPARHLDRARAAGSRRRR